MVPVSHRVTDISQVKLHAQEGGMCVSLKEGEWVWLAKEVARHLGTMLDLVVSDVSEVEDEDVEESDYEVSYQLPGSNQVHKMTVQGVTEMDAMIQFYENAPEEYKAHISKVEVVKK